MADVAFAAADATAAAAVVAAGAAAYYAVDQKNQVRMAMHATRWNATVCDTEACPFLTHAHQNTYASSAVWWVGSAPSPLFRRCPPTIPVPFTLPLPYHWHNPCSHLFPSSPIQRPTPFRNYLEDFQKPPKTSQNPPKPPEPPLPPPKKTHRRRPCLQRWPP